MNSTQQRLAESIESVARDLRRTPAGERMGRGYEKQLEILFERVFDLEGLRSIGDPRLLDDLAEILRDNNVEETYPDAIVRLEHQRGLVAEAHDKLSAILDPTLSSRDLLYGVLETWVEMPEGFGVRFSAQQESELEAVRFGDGSPVQRLKAFLEPYASFIEAAGRPVQQIRRILETEVPLLERLSVGHAVNALFAERGGSAGRALRVFISIAPGTGEEFGTNTVDETMKIAVRQGVAAAFTLAQMPRARSNVNWSIDEATTFEGGSIGLATSIGVLAGLRGVDVEPYAAFTGTIAPDGAIGAVQYVAAKVAAAGRTGVSRVFVPIDNFEEANAAAGGFVHLQVIGVSSLAEAWSALVARPRSASAASTSLSVEVRRVELACVHAGMKVYDKVKRTGQVQLKVTDGTSKGSITVYQGKSGFRLVPGGAPKTALHATLTNLANLANPSTTQAVERRFERWQVPAPDDQRCVEESLRLVGGATDRPEANCSYRIDFQSGGERVVVRQFTSGTLTLQQVAGTEQSPLFFDLRGRIRAGLGQPFESPPNISSVKVEGVDRGVRDLGVDPAHVFTGSWIGTDEAGKGDYFGPLVSAAVYVDDSIASHLQHLGVRDSKKLSDRKVRELAAAIRNQVGTRVLRVLPLVPSAYNRLQAQFVKEGKTLTTLLAWAHARAIEDLLKRDVDTENVLVDQFTDVQYIKAALLAEGRKRQINLIALPRAEANIAVAAASILARDSYLAWMHDQSRRLGFELPKGSSDAVVSAARELLDRVGEPQLGEYVKLHFRTTQRVLESQPREA